jgi:quinol-cytochrome oxidoreductase complex cytochrome b subunit
MKRPTFFEHLHPPSIPEAQARFRYTLGLGGLSVFFFLITAFTGALLLFYYAPTEAGANASVQLLQYHVPLGWLVRGLHFWSAQALVLVVALHLLRVALTGGFRGGRQLNWLLGIGLLLLVLMLDFTGYGLRWDESIGWAVVVGTNLLRLVPLAGETIYRWAVGGPELGGPTILRFYGWHVFGLTLPAFGVLVWHLFRVRRDGGIAHPARSASPEPRLPRSELVRRELIAALIAGALLLVVSVAVAPALQGPFDPATPVSEAQAPWFFLFIQELLRLGDARLMGVILPAAGLIVLALLPYGIDRGTSMGRWFPRDGRLTQVISLTLAACVGLLTIQGAWR